MPINSLEDLVFNLINEIGLGITPDGFLYDQDTNSILRCGGFQIKASVDKFNPAISTDLYTAFDPVFDNKLMGFILGYYLSKSEANGYINPLSISEYTEDIPYYMSSDYIHSRKSGLIVVCDGGFKYSSNKYFQKGLKYSDMILRIGGNPWCDLVKFDTIPEESIQGVY